ncbi:MAG: hypothetical protein ACYC9Q_14405 [Bacillota bacterium]
MEFLANIDPDVVKSFVPLDDSVVETIDRLVSPYSIEVPGPGGQQVSSFRLVREGLDVRVNAQDITAMTRPHWGERKLVAFDVSEVTDEVVRSFVSINFGTVDLVDDSMEVENIKVTDRVSLVEGFRQLADQAGVAHVFPSQFCSIPDYLPEPGGPRLSGGFVVVIGDLPVDAVHMWNRALARPSWSRHYTKEVWLPVSLAEDPDFIEPFAQWLQEFAGDQVEVCSCSLSRGQLRELAHPFNVVSGLPSQVSVCVLPEDVSFSYSGVVRLESGMELFRLGGTNEKIVLKEPQSPLTPLDALGQKYWVADIYLQHLSPDLPSGGYMWWQLPRANFLVQSLFASVSRVGPGGFPSVMMQMGDPTLQINIPDDESPIISYLSRGRSPHACMTDDPRMKLKRGLDWNVDRSDKGGYLKGFIGMFSGLYDAYDVLSERYWRIVFGQLADVKSESGPTREAVVNKLRKATKGGKGLSRFETEEGIEWLGELVLQLAKGSREGLELGLDEFIVVANSENEAYNSRLKDNPFPFEEGQVLQAVEQLLALRVLELGIRARCPACGQVSWFSIDEAGQILKCKGCNSPFSIAPNPRWRYRLNGLVREGIAQHGLVPVVLALGEALQASLTSFFYSTGLELRKPGANEPFAEVDLAIIQDGKFIIGEIKQSVKLFSQADFDKLEEVAAAIRPDEVFVSSLDQSPSSLVRSGLKALGEHLEPLGIRVTWRRLSDHVFEPSPIL